MNVNKVNGACKTGYLVGYYIFFFAKCSEVFAFVSNVPVIEIENFAVNFAVKLVDNCTRFAVIRMEFAHNAIVDWYELARDQLPLP